MQFTVGTIIDIIMAVCILFAVVRGWQTGLVIKLAHLVAVIAACVLAAGMVTLLKGKTGGGIVLPLAAAVCFLIAVVILYHLIKALHLIDYIPVVGKLNKIGGAVVGFIAEFIFIYVICSILFGIIPQTMLDQWGLSEDVISQTYLLQAFFP